MELIKIPCQLCHPYENELTNKHKCENERQWKKKSSRHMYDIASIKRVTRKFHVAVVRNNSKEMYKKSTRQYNIIQ